MERRGPGKLEKRTAPAVSVHKLETGSNGFFLLSVRLEAAERNQGANSIVQSLCACNDARSEISMLAIGFGWERQTAAV